MKDKQKKEKESVSNIPEQKIPEREFLGFKLSRLKSSLVVRVIVLTVVNIILVIATFVVLNILNDRADEISKLKSAEVAQGGATDVVVLQADIAKHQQNISRIEQAFADENRLVDFVIEIDNLKREGVVTRFNFDSNTPIIDKTRNPGLRFTLEFRGERNTVNAAIQKVESLGFIIRPETVELTKSQESADISVLYRAIIYVKEDLVQN